ncbi:GGDEF domain-containing protein [Blautia sp. HCP3S3_C4]|uniref:GGDEF domain-containing protein n=1 Tax=Blautia sp. HCP3S3_C4 TaxID=3438911 RepID=UPI003F8A2CAE|nr:GGDEF domain-containing protein [Ruminococcus sp.]
MANGLTVLMMWFLLLCRRKNRESLHVGDKIYDGMAIVNLLGALSETIAFLVDGKQFIGSRQINYVSNSICFIGTVSIGLLWCLYVELRIYRNYKRIFKKARFVMFPWVVEVIMVLCNLLGTGIMFKISEGNIYQRAAGAIVGYISLIIYFAYSIYLVHQSKKQGMNLNFFPVIYFVGPCFAGVLIQFLFYGITSSWVLVAVALIFVQMQSYAENLYMDELSGLYNRRYLNAVLTERKITIGKSLYGIMMDVNDFKYINDNFGHSMGDKAICTLGNILLRSIPDGGIAIRYAGDEFIVLLSGVDTERVLATMDEINHNLSQFNESKIEPFTLSVSMGYAEFGAGDDTEAFLMHMDEKMYEEKRKYHLLKKSNSSRQ